MWRGERAYRPNDANNFNEGEIEVLIAYLCTSGASWLYVYYLYFVRLKMFIYLSHAMLSPGVMINTASDRDVHLPEHGSAPAFLVG